MTTNIPKEQGHTLKQTMFNTLLLNLKTTVPRLQKEHQNCSKNIIKIAPNQHQNYSINQHLYSIKPAKKQYQNCNRKPAFVHHKTSIKTAPKQHQNSSRKPTFIQHKTIKKQYQNCSSKPAFAQYKNQQNQHQNCSRKPS